MKRLLPALLLVGCAATQPLPADLTYLPLIDLCGAFHQTKPLDVWHKDDPALRARIGAEIVRRGLSTEAELLDLAAGRLKVGMNTCQVIAAWGRPKDINRTSLEGRSSSQYVYPKPGCGAYYCGSNYVYLDNGVVTAIQD